MAQETKIQSVFDLFRKVVEHLDIIEALHKGSNSPKGGWLMAEEVMEALLGFASKWRTVIGVEEDLRFLHGEGWIELSPDGRWRLRWEKGNLINEMNERLRLVDHLIRIGQPRVSA